MLEALFGNVTAERVLLYLQNYDEAYPSEVAQTFEIPVSMVQKQMQRLEEAGVLASQLKGRIRIYRWNPRYPFRNELQALLQKALEAMSEDETRKYFRKRSRPRKAGKPL